MYVKSNKDIFVEKEILVENAPATLKKINGKWQVESLEKKLKGAK